MVYKTAKLYSLNEYKYQTILMDMRFYLLRCNRMTSKIRQSFAVISPFGCYSYLMHEYDEKSFCVVSTFVFSVGQTVPLKNELIKGKTIFAIQKYHFFCLI